jgi:hypothetical protein
MLSDASVTGNGRAWLFLVGRADRVKISDRAVFGLCGCVWAVWGVLGPSEVFVGGVV